MAAAAGGPHEGDALHVRGGLVGDLEVDRADGEGLIPARGLVEPLGLLDDAHEVAVDIDLLEGLDRLLDVGEGRRGFLLLLDFLFLGRQLLLKGIELLLEHFDTLLDRLGPGHRRPGDEDSEQDRRRPSPSLEPPHPVRHKFLRRLLGQGARMARARVMRKRPALAAVTSN